MSTAYFPPLQRSWQHVSHVVTRRASRSPSPVAFDPQGEDQTERNGLNVVSAERGTSARLSLPLIEDEVAHFTVRGDHLPTRGAHAERARLARNMYGYGPLGSVYDAQQVSSDEERVASQHLRLTTFGKGQLVQLGQTRTALEDEHSVEESQALRDGVEMDPDLSDTEGGPGDFVGGHTGHAAASFAAQIEVERQVTQANNQATNDFDAEASFEQRDMDADIEDLDA